MARTQLRRPTAVPQAELAGIDPGKTRAATLLPAPLAALGGVDLASWQGLFPHLSSSSKVALFIALSFPLASPAEVTFLAGWAEAQPEPEAGAVRLAPDVPGAACEVAVVPRAWLSLQTLPRLQVPATNFRHGWVIRRVVLGRPTQSP